MGYLVSIVLSLFTYITSSYAASELVMQENVTIEVQQGGASMKITSGKGIERSYEWDGCKLESRMSERTNRWLGNLGIYDAGFLVFFTPKGCHGIKRPVVEEGQLHVDDMQFLYRWIKKTSEPLHTVWTHDGLLVSWGTVPGRAQLNVNVWMICINGKRPSFLEGATDAAVKIQGNALGQTFHPCARVSRDVIQQTREQYERYWNGDNLFWK